jgi:competence protein ComEC
MDVGNGDCTVVIDEATHSALVVDCPSGRVGQVKKLLQDNDAVLDTCIVTHWDVDHYGGVARLAVSTSVSKVFYNHDTLFADSSSPPYAVRGALKEFLNIADPAKTLRPALAGSEGDVGCVSWRLLAPAYHEVTSAYVAGRRNVASAVVVIAVRTLRIVIGGDAVAATWSRLLSEDIGADILRWPHHGADLDGDRSGSVARLLMEAVSPDYVVVSTGMRNTYGHPSTGIVEYVSGRAHVMCTQVTPGCFGFLSKVDRNSAAARDELTAVTSSGCAGTVEVKCFEDRYRILPSVEEHRLRVSLWPRPLCRADALPVDARAEHRPVQLDAS